jgi:hypothetical protein
MTKLKKAIEQQLEKEFEKKFISPDQFAEAIEIYYRDNEYQNYINAIADYCEEQGIEIESVPKLISKQFKKKIEHQVTKLNCLTTRPLPELEL